MDLHRIFVLSFTSMLWQYGGAEEVCFDDLPCLSDDLRCHSSEYGFPPKTPEEINTRFYLFTRKNRETYQELTWRDDETITSSFYNDKLPTKILIHGFNGGILDMPNIAMKDALLEKGDYNVLSVDWGEGAQIEFSSWNPWDIYYRVRQNTRVVALEVTEMLKRLMALTETSPKELHLIGHSLGAHISGYIGEIVPGIGRITGLDPAGPGFDENQSIFEKQCKLDPTDAEFVDVIHTDGFFGNKFPLGHQDFFPNGGVTQLGCKWTITRNLCDHLRALDLFTESITTACPFIGYPCDSWEDFENRKCTTCKKDGCPRMGFYADQSKASGLFWLGTNDESPFCLDDAGVPSSEDGSWFWWG